MGIPMRGSRQLKPKIYGGAFSFVTGQSHSIIAPRDTWIRSPVYPYRKIKKIFANVPRAINREPQIQGLPLAVEDPNPFDELPSEVDDWSASSGQILTLGNSLNAATESTLSVGSFGREAQACCLFNRVMKVLNNHSMVTLERESVIQALDRDIRKFLGLLMDESSGSWGTFCGSTAMTLA
jgi:hypothetical protein